MRFYKSREEMYTDFIPAMCCAEIGVQKGENAASLLAAGAMELHLIDAWQYYAEGEYTKDPANLRSQADQDWLFGHVLERFKEHTQTGRVHIHRLPSVTAAQLFGEASLDVAYIDAGHDYASVYADLLAWEPVINERGVMMLHDWTGQPKAREMGFGVMDAGIRFMEERKWKLVAMGMDEWPTIAIQRR
jgi:hypothetical protein